MSQKIAQINELLKREVSGILLKEESFDRNVLVTVTRVATTVDLAEAKVFISVIPEDQRKEVLYSLRKDIYIIQQKLNKKLCLRKIPKIVFYEEKSVEQAARIEELLEGLKKEEK